MRTLALDAGAARAFEDCIAAGGLALFPADTVYGLAVDPDAPAAVERLYRLKARARGKPAAIMFFDRDRALEALPELGVRARTAVLRLLPGPVTVVVPNPARRFPAACGPTPERLGIRIPALDGRLRPLADVTVPVLQSSANPAGGSDPAGPEEIVPQIAAGVDLILDAGRLGGVASTVVDLARYESDGQYSILREGALTRERVGALLGND